MRTSRSTILAYLVALAALIACFGQARVVEASHDSVQVRLRADLFGDAAVSGRVIYRERLRNAGLERRFKVQIEDAQPGQPFDIYVGDYFVGTIVANALGRAKVQLRTPRFIDSPGDGQPMPADFPAIERRDLVTAGALSGVLFDRSQEASPEIQRFRLRTSLDGNALLSGHARYLERFRDGQLLRKFKVEVEDGDPGDELDVQVNDLFAGTIVLDAAGSGELQLRTAAFIDDPGDGQPIPDEFPTLLPGDVVTVGPLTGVFQLD